MELSSTALIYSSETTSVSGSSIAIRLLTGVRSVEATRIINAAPANMAVIYTHGLILSHFVGISFLIDLQGVRLFHAGDLNNWHWSEESTPQEIRKAEGDFLAEVKCLQQTAPSVDVALFPVDNRIGKDYMRGAEQFVERIKTTIFVPMHFSEEYKGGNAFREFAESKGCRFLSITHRGESFDINQ